MRRPYPNYRHSGVEWLGEVPEYWGITRLSRVITCLDGRRIPLNAEQRADLQGLYPYWGANGIVDHLDDWLFDEPLVLLGEDGAPFFARNKIVSFSVHGKIWVNNHAHVLRPTGVHQAFLTHLLNCTDYASFIDGSTRDKLTQNDMNAIPVLLPPISEQHSIGQPSLTMRPSVRRWGGALIDADAARISDFALGLDSCGAGDGSDQGGPPACRRRSGQLLDIVRGRTAKAPTRWLLRRPHSWLEQIRWAVLDLSGPYRAAFNAALPDAKQVADPFHVVRLANDALDEVRRRVQNQTLGHRGHKHDPLYRARKLLVSASENITDNGHTKLRGLLDAGDPYGEVRDAWHAKETLRSIYDIDDANLGAATVNQLAQDLQDPAMPPEINRLGRTIWNWRHQISNWHAARVTNAPTEAANNLVKRVKRAAFGFTNFANYRIRALLYAGKPNWALLDTLTPT